MINPRAWDAGMRQEGGAVDDQASPTVSRAVARVPPVLPATLRRWAERGRSAYFVEQGRHRQVSVPEIRALLGGRFRWLPRWHGDGPEQDGWG